MNDYKIGELSAGLEALKETMSSHNTITMSKLDRILDVTAVIDKKADKAHERIDSIVNPDFGSLANIKKVADLALEYGENYNENKKKAVFGAGLLIAIGAGLKALFNFLVTP